MFWSIVLQTFEVIGTGIAVVGFIMLIDIVIHPYWGPQ